MVDMEAANHPAHEGALKPAHSAAAMDIKPPKVAEAPRNAPLSAEAAKPAKPPSKPHVTRSPKQPGSGVGLVVFATIAIVLGLGLLMVYAYLRTNGISIL